MKRKTREEKAITLIALIITIVVLLILAVVAINAVTGDGIIQHAVNAKTEYNEAQYEEQTQLQNYIDILNTHIATYKEYRVGDAVTVGGESFYVIEDSDKTQEKVKLLAKDCIDTTNLVQNASASPVVFCEKSVAGYWSTGTSPYNIVEPEPSLDETTGKLTLPSSHTAAKAAYDYGAKVGGTGRLMRHSEAIVLVSASPEVLFGKNGKSSSTYLIYWLGSAKDTEKVWSVTGDYNLLYDGASYSTTNGYGVRPVVEISKNKIS